MIARRVKKDKNHKNVRKFSTSEKKVRHFWEVSAKGKFFVLRIDGVAAAKLLL